MSEPFRPRLRATVSRMERAGVVVALRQPGTGHEVAIGRVSRALLPLLDGTREREAVLDAVSAERVDRGDAVDALRALLLLGFIEGAGDATHGELLALSRGAPELRFLAESRFTCHGSGHCCRIYELGPIDEDDAKKLETLDLAKAFPHLGPGPHVRRDEHGALFLARADERCVFLLGDARCGLHAAFGADAKPKLCRLYPWRAQLTVAGLRIVDQSECATFPRSVVQGEPLAAQLERIRALLPERPELHHPLVLLDREHPCDYGWVVALEESLLPLFARALGAGAMLAAAGRRVLAFADALARCPLEVGEPERTVSRVLAAPLDVSMGPPRDGSGAPSSAEGRGMASRQSGLAALDVVIEGLLDAIAKKERREPVIPELVSSLEALRARRPIAPSLHAGAVLAASMRNAVFAGRLLCEGSLRAGLLRFALVPLLALAGSELGRAHTAASVGLRMSSLRKALVALEEHAPLVLETAASLLG